MDEEFDRQVKTLLSKGYPKLAGMADADFMELVEPLRIKLQEEDEEAREPGRGIPFVIVVKKELVTTEQAMELVEFGSTTGYVGMEGAILADYHPIQGLEIPESMVYLLMDIDTGRDTLNVTPDDALPLIKKANRYPLVIDEGVAILTQFPDILKRKNCFSLLGSRSGDKRVPALWISYSRPRLGWCWGGNPHTWLGSASAERRIGS